MHRRLLFASFDYVRAKDPSMSLASASIMAYLHSQFGNQQHQHSLSLNHKRYNVKDADLMETMTEVLDDIQQLQPDILATGLYVWNEPMVVHILKRIQETSYKPKYFILGGAQITYSPKGMLEASYPFGDFFIRGYAEESLGKLLKKLIKQSDAYHQTSFNIDGVHAKGEIDKGLKSPYQLHTLPSPLSSPKLFVHNGFIRWETKRGCPFDCAFCQHKDSYDKRLKCDSKRISEEQHWITKNKINDISVVDPIFNSGGEDYLRTLQGFLDVGYRGRLNVQARFEMVKPAFLDLCTLLQANGVNVELEFGVQTIIKSESQIIKRLNNLKRITPVAEELRARNIPFEVFLIYGLPQQTLDSFQSSIEWVQTFVKPGSIKAWPLMLLKGTPLYDKKDEYRLREKILDENLEELDQSRQYKGIPHVVESSTFTETVWNEMRKLAICINNG